MSFVGCRSARVRIKAPTIKEVLHFKRSEVENLCEPKSNEAKESEIKRFAIHLETLLKVQFDRSRWTHFSPFVFFFKEVFQRKVIPVNDRKTEEAMTQIKHGSAPKTVTCPTGALVQVVAKQFGFVIYLFLGISE